MAKYMVLITMLASAFLSHAQNVPENIRNKIIRADTTVQDDLKKWCGLTEDVRDGILLYKTRNMEQLFELKSFAAMQRGYFVQRYQKNPAFDISKNVLLATFSTGLAALSEYAAYAVVVASSATMQDNTTTNICAVGVGSAICGGVAFLMAHNAYSIITRDILPKLKKNYTEHFLSNITFIESIEYWDEKKIEV